MNDVRCVFPVWSTEARGRYADGTSAMGAIVPSQCHGCEGIPLILVQRLFVVNSRKCALNALEGLQDIKDYRRALE